MARTPAHTYMLQERGRERGEGGGAGKTERTKGVCGWRERIKNRDEGLGMVVPAYHSALRRLRQEDGKLEGNLGYRVSFSPITHETGVALCSSSQGFFLVGGW